MSWGERKPKSLSPVPAKIKSETTLCTVRIQTGQNMHSKFIKTTSKSLLCYSACLIKNLLNLKEFYLALPFRIKWEVPVQQRKTVIQQKSSVSFFRTDSQGTNSLFKWSGTAASIVFCLETRDLGLKKMAIFFLRERHMLQRQRTLLTQICGFFWIF